MLWAGRSWLGLVGLSLLGCDRRPLEWNAGVEERLLAAIERDPDHPWAGEYSGSDLTFCWESIVLSPEGYFTAHTSCCLVTDERVGGDVHFDGRWVHLEADESDLHYRPRGRYLFVPWGEARFLVPDDRLDDFVNGHESYRNHRLPGSGIVVAGVEFGHAPLEGVPQMEEPWSSRLRLAAEVVCLSTESVEQEERSTVIRVTLQGGADLGLWEGLRLWAGETACRIVEVGPSASVGRIVLRSVDPDLDTDFTGELFVSRRP